MWPFDYRGDDPDRPFPAAERLDSVDLDHEPDARHVDVAILWGLGQEERAHYLARRLRPAPQVHYHVTADDLSDDELRRVRERFEEGGE